MLVTILTVPFIFGSLVVSIRPTSQVNTLETGSNECLPWLGIRVQFNTLLGIGTSMTTFSI